MSKADAVAGIMLVGVTLYAVFGGADFGAGFWSLVAGGGERGKRPRELIDWAIGPVWEANHVWLIFVLVVLWTAFSEAFAAIFSTLFIPLSLAALGIVLRGAGFAFQGTARRLYEEIVRQADGAGSANVPVVAAMVAAAADLGGDDAGAAGAARVPPGPRPGGGHRGPPAGRAGIPLAAAAARGPGRALRLDLETRPREWFPARLRHILDNLLSNALRYRDPAKAESWVRLAGCGRRGGERVAGDGQRPGAASRRTATSLFELLHRAARPGRPGWGSGWPSSSCWSSRAAGR